MKRISQTKFASSLFSCLGVAACVAFSSCGKKDNDQFKNANEFADFLKSKAQERGVSIDDDQLTEFANANWKTASKKTFKFTEEIQNQIAGEDLDNEDEEMTDPEQSNPEQQNPGTEQSNQEQQNPGTEQPKTGQANQEQPKTGTEHPKPTTASPSGTETISDDKTLSELIKTEDEKHVGVKIGDKYFDLNVFYGLYSWIYNKAAGQKTGLFEPDELTWGNVKTIIKKSQFNTMTDNLLEEEKKFGIKDDVSKKWTEENTIYTYDFTASSDSNGAQKLECLCYNGLLKFWAQANDLGFSGEAFQNGTLNKDWSNCGGAGDEVQKQKINSVVAKLVACLKK